MADLLKTPEFFQTNHGFPEHAQKVISDPSYVAAAYQANLANPTQELNTSLGDGVRHMTTLCVMDQVKMTLGAGALFPNTEVLKCHHGLDLKTGKYCIRSVLGATNPEKLVLATNAHADLADEVMGLPVIMAAPGGGGMVYLDPSPAQVEYVAEHNQEEIARICKVEKAWGKQRRKNLRRLEKKKGGI